MTASTAASLVNLLGFTTGIVLYVMLLWMVLTSRSNANRLVLFTGLLGFAWNVGAFGGYGLSNLGFTGPVPLVLAAAFSSLCFLPAVVVHSALSSSERLTRSQYAIVGVAYLLSGAATVMNFYSAATSGIVPSQSALRGVTIGFGMLLIALLVVTGGRHKRGRVLWVAAMAVFAVSALHLSTNHGPGDDPWWLELVGHHASLPLAFLILYQDFRFALADIFLKRALAFTLLAGLTFAMFVFGVNPLVAAGPLNERTTALLLALWVATALAYPILRRVAALFVDKIVLARVDYTDLLANLSRALDRCETPQVALDQTAGLLAPALSAKAIDWEQSEGNLSLRSSVQQDRRSAHVTVLTTEEPHYMLSVRELSGGRRLLSDDIAMLEHAALLAARRIDGIRSMQERYRRDLQEQEVRKLAAEAELRALRAQVNPHFLFNALTTIGYLIQTAPERALGTLMRLSGLLRGVLRSGDEFVTIGEELDLIEAYLDIERARFEDRLRVRIDVPWELRRIRIPALVIQPLVENAIKHGISECLAGGEVRIGTVLHEDELRISVVDTGIGVTQSTIERRQARGGLGLSNIEQRLRRYSNLEKPMIVRSTPGEGTTVEIRIPVQAGEMAVVARHAKSS